jgi:hypothetical protein
MHTFITRFFSSRIGIITTGAVIGLLAVLLQHAGNPPNMGMCVACFERDIAGALGFHRAAAVQYLRPEIFAFVLGSFAVSLVSGEFRPRGGSAPLVRFFLGLFAMIGALAFLGCPWRALLRLSAGDFNAVTGIAGLAGGIGAGVFFLASGYNPGRSGMTRTAAGLIFPLLMTALLFLRFLRPSFGPDAAVFSSVAGPGSLHAPLWLSLGSGLLTGVLGQRSRFCMVGAFRNVFVMRDWGLMSGAAALVVSATVMNIIFNTYHAGIAGRPVAHSSHLWNFLGMSLAGLSCALAGGCPGRQLFLAGEGDCDAAVFVLGMIAGAGVSHNFMLAGRPDAVVEGVVRTGGLTAAGMFSVVIGLAFCLYIGWSMRETE